MSDAHSTPTPPPETPLANDPNARTPTGEIKDLQATPEGTTPKTEPEAKVDLKVEPKPADPAGPPDKYEFKAPEGQTIDAKTVEAATPLFKELGLTNDQGQKLFDFYTAQIKDITEAPGKAYTEMRDSWRSEIIKDPALGDGKGLKPEVSAKIGRVVDSLGPELAKGVREAMNLTGAGDNPAIIRAWSKLADLVSEGTAVRGGSPSPGGQKSPDAKPKSAASALYPNLA